jgi:hypothetical protein
MTLITAMSVYAHRSHQYLASCIFRLTISLLVLQASAVFSHVNAREIGDIGLVVAARSHLPLIPRFPYVLPHIAPPAFVIPQHVQHAQILRPPAPLQPRPGPPRRGVVIPQ